MLHLNDVTLRIGGRPLLDQASVHLPAGQRAGLVGANGSGKTSLLRLILGELTPDGGEVRLRRGARVGSGAKIEGSMLFDGAVVAAGAVVENSVIGAGAFVEEGASVRDTVVGDRAVIGAHCELRNNMRIWPDVSLPPHGVRFSPDVVSLEPGDQVLVQVVAGVDGTFEPGVRYGAEISIPELAAAGIPLVVRRRTARPRKA